MAPVGSEPELTGQVSECHPSTYDTYVPRSLQLTERERDFLQDEISRILLYFYFFLDVYFLTFFSLFSYDFFPRAK